MSMLLPGCLVAAERLVEAGTTALAEAADPSARTATPAAQALFMPGSAEPMTTTREDPRRQPGRWR